MAKTARSSKKASHKPTKRTHPLHKEVPTLNAFVVIFYILIFILGVGIYFTRFN